MHMYPLSKQVAGTGRQRAAGIGPEFRVRTARASGERISEVSSSASSCTTPPASNAPCPSNPSSSSSFFFLLSRTACATSAALTMKRRVALSMPSPEDESDSTSSEGAPGARAHRVLQHHWGARDPSGGPAADLSSHPWDFARHVRPHTTAVVQGRCELHCDALPLVPKHRAQPVAPAAVWHLRRQHQPRRRTLVFPC